ncbi:MAG: helix-turn-helix domain-containing protein [Faecalibacterium sp.]|nr:helix-turn-helix domain-containing protein [Ruminococcus sp.]MCM1393227.1 helix-turn-helix domain-containing protein [Ruminococcus sp.]MCM1485769.1 helix-turn-helix domain-containing protein [Faecalibacterium sp.]
MSDTIDSIIKRLKSSIEKSGFTYVELEEKTGIAKSSIQRYATGSTKKIPIDAIQLIADAVNVSAAWIMGWSESSLSVATHESVSYMEQKLLNDFRKLNHFGQEKALVDISDLTEIVKYTEQITAEKKNA